MKISSLSLGAIVAAVVSVAACGGGSGGGESSEDPGTASVGSFSSLPSVDLSNYDYSASGAQAMIAKSMHVGKAVGAASSNKSRAGCEVNSQKDNIIRQSKMAQLERCFPEAMEAGSLISIPSDEYAYYHISVPAEPGGPGEKGGGCGGAGGKSLYMRLGRFTGGSELHVDTCFDRGSGVTQAGSSTYRASGDDYLVSVVRVDSCGDQTFNGSLNIAFSGVSVANGVATFDDTTGQVVVDGAMRDNFGRGSIHFGAFASDHHNEVRGAFTANFDDEVMGGTQAFTNKVFSQFGGAEATKTGSAKFYFNGSFPAFPVSNMVPPGMPDSAKPQFFQFMSTMLGTTVNAANYTTLYTCPNPACSPEDPAGCQPVLDTDGDHMCSQEMTKVESFSISGTPPDLTFLLIDSANSAFFTAVNAFDLANIAIPADAAIPFTRDWNCQPSGSWIEVDPTNADLTAAQFAALQSKMEACQAIQQSAQEFKGMGEYRCHEEEVQNNVQGKGECTSGECQFDPWEGLQCFPETATGMGPLKKLWDDNPVTDHGALQTWLGSYDILRTLCTHCKESKGETPGGGLPADSCGIFAPQP